MPRRNKRSAHGRFAGIPHCVVDSASYAELKGNAAKLLVLMCRQYNSNNNGDLTATWEQMSMYFGSNNTLRDAIKELKEKRLIQVTGVGTTSRKGGHPPTLYAITWEPINEYYGKGNMTSMPTTTPIRNDWDKPKKPDLSKNSKFHLVQKLHQTPQKNPGYGAETAPNPQKSAQATVQFLHQTQDAKNDIKVNGVIPLQ